MRAAEIQVFQISVEEGIVRILVSLEQTELDMSLS